MTNKDLISQYVRTGLQLPRYQLDKLSNQDKKTYIRQRLIGINITGIVEYNDLDDYEFQLLSPEDRTKFAIKLLENNILSTDLFLKDFISNRFELLPVKGKKEFLKKLTEKGFYLYIFIYFYKVSPEYAGEYLIAYVENKDKEYINLNGLDDLFNSDIRLPKFYAKEFINILKNKNFDKHTINWFSNKILV